MSIEQQAEVAEIKRKTEVVRLASERVEDAAQTVRICLDPETGQADYLTEARANLWRKCLQLMADVDDLAPHGKGS